jgi:nuclear pore complex protein Nup98-Nup96
VLWFLQLQNMGSRAAPYVKHQDKDTSSTNAASNTVVYYTSITAMPIYAHDSVEELRWQDYSAGVKNASSAPPPAAAAAAPAGGAFGGAFGAAAGGGPALGASAASPFGGTSSESS